jgi:hypothetical protein
LSVDASCWFSGVHLAATKRRENCFRRFSLVNKAGRYCSNKSFCIPSPGLISPHTIDSVTEISLTLSFSKRNCRSGRISHKKRKIMLRRWLQDVLYSKLFLSLVEIKGSQPFIATQIRMAIFAKHRQCIVEELTQKLCLCTNLVGVQYIGNGCTLSVQNCVIVVRRLLLKLSPWVSPLHVTEDAIILFTFLTS